jgi:enamine deaminase RidA (YjgF/YER057c/UK114 family)
VSRRLINPPELYDGVPYSYVAVAREGGTVFTAGACPLDADGGIVGAGDVGAQTRQTLATWSWRSEPPAAGSRTW